MVSDPNLVFYASVSKGNMILAEISSGDSDLETLALQCIEKTPNFHITYSHTIRNKIYSFLMEDPYVYFTIVDEQVGNSQSLQFLDRVKTSFLKLIKKKSSKRLEKLTSHCFHEEFNPLFRNSIQSPVLSSKKSRNESKSLIGNQNRNSKKKKTSDEKTIESPIEKKVDLSSEVNLTREFSTSVLKNGSYVENCDYLQAKKMWRKHVWTVLLIDLMICLLLLGVWLWICRGFHCIAS